MSDTTLINDVSINGKEGLTPDTLSETLQDNTINALGVDASSRTIWVNGQPYGNAYVNIKDDNTLEAPIGAEIFNDFEHNVASGEYSHAHGYYTETTNTAEAAFGQFNQSIEGSTLFSIGDGDSDDSRHNIVEVTENGVNINTNLNVEDNLKVDGTTTLNGPVTLGDAEGDTITVNGDTHFTGDIVIDGLGDADSGNNDALLENAIIVAGSGEGSGVMKGAGNSATGKNSFAIGQDNEAISENSVAMGSNNRTGLKGWYYGSIYKENDNTISVYLSKTQKVLIISSEALKTSPQTADTSLPNLLDILGEGTLVSLINDSKYDDKFKIIGGSNGVVRLQTVDGSDLPFSVIKAELINEPEDYSIYCLSMPDKGLFDMGQGSFAFGYNNKATNGKATAFGYNNHAYGKFSFVEGRDNKAGYGAHAEGRDNVASGYLSHAEGGYAIAEGAESHAEGWHTTAKGAHSHAEGTETTAAGNDSHAEGANTKTVGRASHAEGIRGTATGNYSHVEGSDSISTGVASHAEGYKTHAKGNYTHAEGQETSAEGKWSHAEGFKSQSKGDYSHSEGYNTIAESSRAHTEGYLTKALGENSHAEGNTTIAEGNNSHAEGSETKSEGINSHAEGYSTKALGENSHAEGNTTISEGNNSHAEGNQTIAKGAASHAEGSNSHAEGSNSHAEGNTTIAEGNNSHAEGNKSYSVGPQSHAEGNETKAAGSCAHAEGYKTQAIGKFSHAEGNTTIAEGNNSHAEGYKTLASGQYSHAEGYSTKTTNDAETAIGKYNESTQKTENNTTSDATHFSIGIGTAETVRKNAFEIKQNGDVYIDNGDVHIEKNTTIEGQLGVNSTTTLNGNTTIGTTDYPADLTVNGNILGKQDLDISGSATLDQLDVTTTTTLNGNTTIGTTDYPADLTVNGNAKITGTLHGESNVILGKTTGDDTSYVELTVENAGTSGITGNLNIGTTSSKANLTVSNNLTASNKIQSVQITSTGKTTASSLQVNNAANIWGNTTIGKLTETDNKPANLTVNGNIIGKQDLDISGIATLKGTLGVDGLTMLKGDVTLGDEEGDTITVNGDTYFIKDVDITKTFTVKGKTTVSELESTGNVDLKSLDVMDDTTIGRTLEVSGKLIVGEDDGTISTENKEKANILVYGGGMVLGDDGFIQTGNLHARNRLNVRGQEISLGKEGGTIEILSTLNVTNDTTIGGTLGVDSNTTIGGTLGVTGATTIGGTLGVTGHTTVSTLESSGNVDLKSLDVMDDTTIGGTLGVDSNTTIGGTLGVVSNTTIGGTLGVVGKLIVGEDDETISTENKEKANILVYGGGMVLGDDGFIQTGNLHARNRLNVRGQEISLGKEGGTVEILSTLDVKNDVNVYVHPPTYIFNNNSTFTFNGNTFKPDTIVHTYNNSFAPIYKDDPSVPLNILWIIHETNANPFDPEMINTQIIRFEGLSGITLYAQIQYGSKTTLPCTASTNKRTVDESNNYIKIQLATESTYPFNKSNRIYEANYFAGNIVLYPQEVI